MNGGYDGIIVSRMRRQTEEELKQEAKDKMVDEVEAKDLGFNKDARARFLKAEEILKEVFE